MDSELSTVRATVRSLDGFCAIVEIEQGGCGRCHEKGGCGGQHLTQAFCSGQKTYRVENLIGARIGDHVVVAVAAGDVRRTANLAYGLPLVAMILGAMAGAVVGSDLGAIFGAAVGLLAAYIGLRISIKGGAGRFLDRPKIVSKF